MTFSRIATFTLFLCLGAKLVQCRNSGESMPNLSTQKTATTWWHCEEESCTYYNESCYAHSYAMPKDILYCGSGSNVTVLTYNCATFDNDEGFIEAGTCVYNAGNTNNRFLSLPMNLNQLNEFMCAEKFNRDSTLCGKCKSGYYPLVHSFDTNCVKCTDAKSNWWKFVAVAFLPLTVFYFIVLLCRINITSSNLYGFVWYCQMMYTPRLARIFIISLRNNKHFQTGMRLLGMVYGIWNLDFFRSLKLDICLGTDTLQSQGLDLAVGIYPLVLLVLTYIFKKYYDRNFRPIVIIWKPIDKLVSFFHSNFLSSTSLIDVYATFFLLTNVKFFNIAFDLLAPVVVYRYNSEGDYSYTLRLYYDATIPYLQGKHLPYALLAIGVLAFCSFLPMVILALYPFSWYQKFLTLLPIRLQFLHTFVDAFQGCYKDGTQPGTRDCRWFVSLFFLVRFLLFLMEIFTPTLTFFPMASMLLVLFTILLITVQPFKNNIGTFNTIFVLLLAMFYASSLGVHIADENPTTTVLVFSTITALVGLFPLLYVSAIVLHWIYNHKKFGFKTLCAWKSGYSILVLL